MKLGKGILAVLVGLGGCRGRVRAAPCLTAAGEVKNPLDSERAFP